MDNHVCQTYACACSCEQDSILLDMVNELLSKPFPEDWKNQPIPIWPEDEELPF